jgi:photosynthetic reaction center cytochrome c subunit
MFPKWFDKWNSDNPTNIFGPAIAVGVAGGAVFVAAMIVAWGQPFATTSQQTGPRVAPACMCRSSWPIWRCIRMSKVS